jgi:hypothetical protein
MQLFDADVMPTSEAILAGLSATANEWWIIAVFWHVFVAALLLAVAVHRDLSHRLVGTLLVLPLLSVSALAWAAHNPFNGAVFAALSILLARIARHLPSASIRLASRPIVLSGAALVAFGWAYPHFLDTEHWTLYLIAAPLGLLPCPTLAAVSGLTLICGGFRSRTWTLSLAVACAAYALIGIFRLAVIIDVGLLAGAAMLLALRTNTHSREEFREPGSLQHRSAIIRDGARS